MYKLTICSLLVLAVFLPTGKCQSGGSGNNWMQHAAAFMNSQSGTAGTGGSNTFASSLQNMIQQMTAQFGGGQGGAGMNGLGAGGMGMGGWSRMMGGEMPEGGAMGGMGGLAALMGGGMGRGGGNPMAGMMGGAGTGMRGGSEASEMSRMAALLGNMGGGSGSGNQMAALMGGGGEAGNALGTFGGNWM